MIRIIVSMLILINILQANDERYYIQLGSFKQLQVLEKSIEALPYGLRSHVIVVRSNNWYVPFAYYTNQKNLLYSKVSDYKRYFPDAYINHSSYLLNHPIVHNYSESISEQQVPASPQVNYDYNAYSTPVIKQGYQNVAISEEDNTLNIPVRTSTPQPIQQPIPVPQATAPQVEQTFTPIEPISTNYDNVQKVIAKRYPHFNKKMLSGQHYYLAYKSTNDSPSLLIKVSFENHEVTYQPVMGDMQMTKANYLIENNRLYMFAESFTQDGAFSTLDEHRDDHFLVSSWANNKKLNTLRYYYRLNDAKEYLGIAKSKGLASTLEDGSFDDNFLDE